jgi:hypothetical protein
MLVGTVDEQGFRRKVVLKLRKPESSVGDGHWEGTSLACELACSMMARAIGLGVPDYYIVNVSRDLLSCLPDRQVRDLLSRNLGENYGSEYKESMGLWDPDTRKRAPALLQRLEDVLSFDAAVINGDRKHEKPNLLWRKDEMLLIDHSLALPVHLWDDATIAESPLFPRDEIRQHCAFQAMRARRRVFERVYGSWNVDLDDTEIAAIRNAIPASWERQTGDLDKIFRFLSDRPGRFLEMSADLREVTR